MDHGRDSVQPLGDSLSNCRSCVTQKIVGRPFWPPGFGRRRGSPPYNCDESSVPGLRRRASRGHFPDRRAAVWARCSCAPCKVESRRARDHRSAFRAAVSKLCGLFDFCALSRRHRELAANVAAPALRLGNGRRDRGDVERQPPLV